MRCVPTAVIVSWGLSKMLRVRLCMHGTIEGQKNPQSQYKEKMNLQRDLKTDSGSLL